jgi:Tol biopolymer transport system component
MLMGGYNDFSISPDDSQIAYIGCEDESCIFHVQNISTGFEKTNSISIKSNNYFGIGNIKWAPDGKRLVFATQGKNYLIQTIYLNLSTMQPKVIKEYIPFDSPGWAVFQGWVDNRTLEFAESSDNGIRIIHIDVESKKVFLVGTPTPNK